VKALASNVSRLNIFMNKYLATVRVRGNTVRTMVFADSSLHARLILEYQFGIGNVAVSQTSIKSSLESSEKVLEVLKVIKPIKTIKPIIPLSPEKARIKTLKQVKDTDTQNLQRERDRLNNNTLKFH
jgi:hypothetical protein